MKKTTTMLLLLLASNTNAGQYYLKIMDEASQSMVETTYHEWESTVSIFTEWLDINTPYNESIFLPEITTETSDFTQTKTYSQDRERYEQKREYDPIKKTYQEIESPIRHSDTISKEITRQISVVDNGWQNVGISTDCADWTPLPNTIPTGQKFNQERICQQEKTKTLDYYVNIDLEDTKIVNEIQNDTQTQQNTGTKIVYTWKRTSSFNIYTKQSYSDYYNDTEYFPEPIWIPAYQKNSICSNLNERKHFQLSPLRYGEWSSTWYNYQTGQEVNETILAYTYDTEVWTCSQ